MKKISDPMPWYASLANMQARRQYKSNFEKNQKKLLTAGDIDL